ncbi:MAG: hypothetical protein PHS93_10285, partial [Candidatus Omnitrophica bacterium]|nr:hypothetical protein [Candidatus Omnitrophota bacterium]
KTLQGGGSGTESTSPVTVSSIQVVNKTFTYDASNTTYSHPVTVATFGVKLHLYNTVAADLEDIELELPMEIDAENDIESWIDLSSNWNLSDKDITGNYAEATLVGDSISLDASQSNKKVTVNMKLVVTGDISDIDITADEDDVLIVDWGYE